MLATGRSVVAEEAGRLLAFASAWARDGNWFLASLFVAPRWHGRGIGQALLDAVWDDAVNRRTITDAIQRRGIPHRRFRRAGGFRTI